MSDAEVAQLVALAEGERHHEARIKPDAFHDDVGGDEVPHEIAFAFGCRDVERSSVMRVMYLLMKPSLAIIEGTCSWSENALSRSSGKVSSTYSKATQ